MERKLEDWELWYKATLEDYPIADNVRPATYDQFITLRDTLVYTNKYYGSSAWRSLIIGTKLDWTPTNTIEIREPNMYYQTFEPWWSTDDSKSVWTYTKAHGGWLIACDIVKTWRYRIQHKEQFNSLSSVTRVRSYVVQHKWDLTTQNRAMFDWEWSTAWELKRLTSFGYVECNLDRWDWLELKIEDQNWNSIIWNMEYDSNWWMVEYIDLAY